MNHAVILVRLLKVEMLGVPPRQENQEGGRHHERRRRQILRMIMHPSVHRDQARVF
jgi:hypothetical protein